MYMSYLVRDALFPGRRQAGGIRTAAALHNLGEEAMGGGKLPIDERGGRGCYTHASKAWVVTCAPPNMATASIASRGIR